MDLDAEASKKHTGRLDKLERRMQQVDSDVNTIQGDLRIVRSNQDNEMQRGVTQDNRVLDLSENLKTLIAALEVVKAATTGEPPARQKRLADVQLQRTDEAV